MNKIKIYHNTRCKKSRAGLQYIQEKGFEIEIIEYLKNPIDKAELDDLLMKLNKKPQEIIRTQETLYKTLFKGKNFTDHEWGKILVEKREQAPALQSSAARDSVMECGALAPL